jgi:hypothetical protein
MNPKRRPVSDFDKVNFRVEEFQNSLPLEPVSEQDQFLHLSVELLRIRVMFPCKRLRRSTLTDAAREIRSVILQLMVPPCPTALHVEQFVESDLFIHNWLSKEND